MSKKKIILIIVIIIVFLMVFFVPRSRKTQNNDLIVSNTSADLEDNTIAENKVDNMNKVQIKVNNQVLDVELEDNSSTSAFVERLKDGDIIVNAHDYGNFEKVGDLGFSLPTNDEKTTTKPGDLILYQGNQITLYYDTNTWNFTKLGKVNNTSQEELKSILGNGDVTLTFTLEQ